MNETILDNLPEVKFFRKCSNYGSNEWTAFNLDKTNTIVMNCNNCCEVKIDEQKD